MRDVRIPRFANPNDIFCYVVVLNKLTECVMQNALSVRCKVQVEIPTQKTKEVERKNTRFFREKYLYTMTAHSVVVSCVTIG